MKPLNLSDDPNNDEETLSFLAPPQPPIHITVTNKKDNNNIRSERNKNRARRHRRHHGSKTAPFCVPWMIESIIFMTSIVLVVLIKINFFTASSHPLQDVTEWEDLSLEDITHWCLDENTTDCACSNPLLPLPRHGYNTWSYAFRQNVKEANNDKKQQFRDLDVVFLGDSILEGFKGQKFGKNVIHKQDNTKVFQSLFNMDYGGKFDGLILAIAGDKSPNLLWRIQNGEFPKALKSKVYWILIGTNDFLKDGIEHCSEEVILMGIKRVVEEIQLLKPESTIVINGILPRATKESGGRLYNTNGDKTIMNAIDNVNEELKDYCNQSDNLLYFDAKDVFIDTDSDDDDDNGQHQIIPQTLMQDYLHPTTLGYQELGKKIVHELRMIIDGQLSFS